MTNKVTMPEAVAEIQEIAGIEIFDLTDYGKECGLTVGQKFITTTQAEAYADARVREVQQWQPIETAPKDGTRVILAWGGKSIGGFFLDNSRSQIPWSGWRTESMVPMPAGQPSHWMPLPPPPTK